MNKEDETKEFLKGAITGYIESREINEVGELFEIIARISPLQFRISIMESIRKTLLPELYTSSKYTEMEEE